MTSDNPLGAPFGAYRRRTILGGQADGVVGPVHLHGAPVAPRVAAGRRAAGNRSVPRGFEAHPRTEVLRQRNGQRSVDGARLQLRSVPGFRRQLQRDRPVLRVQVHLAAVARKGDRPVGGVGFHAAPAIGNRDGPVGGAQFDAAVHAAYLDRPILGFQVQRGVARRMDDEHRHPLRRIGGWSAIPDSPRRMLYRDGPRHLFRRAARFRRRDLAGLHRAIGAGPPAPPHPSAVRRAPLQRRRAARSRPRDRAGRHRVIGAVPPAHPNLSAVGRIQLQRRRLALAQRKALVHLGSFTGGAHFQLRAALGIAPDIEIQAPSLSRVRVPRTPQPRQTKHRRRNIEEAFVLHIQLRRAPAPAVSKGTDQSVPRRAFCAAWRVSPGKGTDQSVPRRAFCAAWTPRSVPGSRGLSPGLRLPTSPAPSPAPGPFPHHPQPPKPYRSSNSSAGPWHTPSRHCPLETRSDRWSRRARSPPCSTRSPGPPPSPRARSQSRSRSAPAPPPRPPLTPASPPCRPHPLPSAGTSYPLPAIPPSSAPARPITGAAAAPTTPRLHSPRRSTPAPSRPAPPVPLSYRIA